MGRCTSAFNARIYSISWNMQLHFYVLSLICLFVSQRLTVNATPKIAENKYFLSVNNLKFSKRSSPSNYFHVNNKDYEPVSDKTNGFVNSDFIRNYPKHYFHNLGIHGGQPQFRRKYTVLLDIKACPVGYIKLFQKFKNGHGFTFCQNFENTKFGDTSVLTDMKQDTESKHIDEADSSDLGKYSIKKRISEILNSEEMYKRSGNRRLSIQGAMSSLAGMLRSSASNRPASPMMSNKDRDTLKYKLFLIGK